MQDYLEYVFKSINNYHNVCAMSTKEKPQMPIVVNIKKLRLDTTNQYTWF